jgi:hypothetical protein
LLRHLVISVEAIEGDAMSTHVANPQHGPPPASEVAHEVSTWGVGGGIVATALFPLAIPILALTAVALLPLVLPVVAVGLAVALVALPVLAVRAAARWTRKAVGRTRAADQAATPAHRGT